MDMWKFSEPTWGGSTRGWMLRVVVEEKEVTLAGGIGSAKRWRSHGVSIVPA